MSTDGRERGHLDEAELNALAEGSAPRAEEARAATHLRGCHACRAELRALRAVVAEARELPRGIAPRRDLWPGVRARIGGDGGELPAPGGAGREDAWPGDAGERAGRVAGRGASGRSTAVLGDRSLRSTRRWLAAAAVLLLVVGAGVTALLLEGGDAGGPASPGAVAGGPASVGEVASVRPAAGPDASRARPASVEESYRGAVERLTGILDRRGDELPPETRAVLERNLEIIDRAIAEAESALARNPGSPALVRALDRSYRRKIDVLQRSARLASQL